jgi:hypothetical protein
MAAHIDRVYGVGAAEKLREKSRHPFKLTRNWLITQIEAQKRILAENPTSK